MSGAKAARAARPRDAGGGPRIERLGGKLNPRIAQNSPAIQAGATCLAGPRFGAWTAIRVDQSGKRIIAVCVCGSVRQIAVDALTDGQSQGCGCSATPRPKVAIERAQRLHDWRPKR